MNALRLAEHLLALELTSVVTSLGEVCKLQYIAIIVCVDLPVHIHTTSSLMTTTMTKPAHQFILLGH